MTARLNPDRLADINDVAGILGIAVPTAQTYVERRHEMPRMEGFPEPLRKIGKSHVWDRAEVTQWARRNR